MAKFVYLIQIHPSSMVEWANIGSDINMTYVLVTHARTHARTQRERERERDTMMCHVYGGMVAVHVRVFNTVTTFASRNCTCAKNCVCGRILLLFHLNNKLTQF